MNSTRSSSTVRTVCPDAGSWAPTPASSEGIAPTGAKVSISGIHIDRFQGDMLVTHRGQLDMHRLYQQLEGG